jgi:hypothetical protein
MVTQTAVVEKSLVAKQQPVQRVRKWVRDHYEWVTVTREQVEQSRKREMYVAAFNPCDVA